MKIGIIVGRFQVPKLTEGHIHLIETALKEFQKVILFLGIPKEGKINLRNPLPFSIRSEMILERYPQIQVYKFRDLGDPPRWIESLDNLLTEISESDSEFIMIGSRDSYLEDYKKYSPVKRETYLIPEVPGVSGTQSRESISLEESNCEEFRKGIIWALNNK